MSPAAQRIDRTGVTAGRAREVRVALLPYGDLIVSRRSMMRSRSGVWRIQAKAPTPPRGRQLYLLRPVPDDPMDDLLTTVMIYWVTGTGTSAARLYWENAHAGHAPQSQ